MSRPTCNLCGSQEFAPYRGRADEQCASCGSKARHRVMWETYRRIIPEGKAQILHLAPEACLHRRLSAHGGTGYRTADYAPERYPHAQAMRLQLPDDLATLADGAFDFILHNHVLEHIPGRFRDWLPGLLAKLAPGGTMVFTVPGPYDIPETLEGGEHLKSDAERLERFLQEDHVRLFGRDLRPWLAARPDGALLPDPVSEERRAEIAVRPGKVVPFLWQRSTGQ